jgi:hypothetical protein
MKKEDGFLNQKYNTKEPSMEIYDYYIILEESMGFGDSGWDTGWYLTVVNNGRIIYKEKGFSTEIALRAIIVLLDHLRKTYKTFRFDYPQKEKDIAKKMLKVVLRESGMIE